MEIRIQVIIDNDERTRRDIARWERTSLTSETLGLQLDEARALLQTSQEAMVSAQADDYLAKQAGCPHCGRVHRLKGRHEIVVRSLFGTLRLGSPRFRHCSCQGPVSPDTRKSFSRWPRRLGRWLNAWTTSATDFSRPCRSSRAVALRAPHCSTKVAIWK